MEKVFSIKNLEMIEGNPQELSQLGLKAPMLCEVLSNALEILKDTGYEIIELSSGRFKLRGIGGNDALHISIAKSFGCDYVASLDRGFWTEKRDLPIYDVSEGVMK